MQRRSPAVNRIWFLPRPRTRSHASNSIAPPDCCSITPASTSPKQPVARSRICPTFHTSRLVRMRLQDSHLRPPLHQYSPGDKCSPIEDGNVLEWRLKKKASAEAGA